MHDCENAKGQINFDCSYPSCTPLPHLCEHISAYVCVHVHTCVCACIHLSMSLCTPINPGSVLHRTGYMLWWEVSGVDSSREERSLSNSTLQYRLTSLTSTTTYTLQVAALTAAGQGAVTSSTISTGVPPGRTSSTHWNPHTHMIRCSGC